MLQEQLTLCDSLAESIKNSQSSETGVQDLMEAVVKRKYFEEELKKNEIEGERVLKELNEMLFANCTCKKSMVSQNNPVQSVEYLNFLRKTYFTLSKLWRNT